jgi:HD-like signal output (HDOD) protein
VEEFTFRTRQKFGTPQPSNTPSNATQFSRHLVDQLSISILAVPLSMISTLEKKPTSTQTLRDEKSIFDYLEDPKSTSTLPSLQSVLCELETLTQKANVRLDEVSRLVQVDQGMSLRVLRMANSVYYAPTQPILDVQEAILYMGLSTFRGAVVSTRCIEQTCHIQQSSLDWKEFWTHAAGVGYVTMDLASRLETSELRPESYYLMGLLHDIGKVILAHLMPERFDQIYARAALEGKSPAKLETESLGVDHGLLGAWYLEKQGIPLALCEAVRFHHNQVIENKPHAKHALLIRLADLLTRHSRLGQSGNNTETGDPFASEEWIWYANKCPKLDADGKRLREMVIEKITGISDLVRNILV